MTFAIRAAKQGGSTLLVAALCLACRGPGQQGVERADTSTAPLAAAVPGAHAVTGRAPITTSGTPAIVVLEPRNAIALPAPAARPAMDQSARIFLPPLLFVRTGHPAEFRNSDEEMHNINVKHGVTRHQAFNVSVATGDSYLHTFDSPGLYDVTCDVHAGMSAQIVVAGSPYVTVAGADGSFSFEGVMSGAYTLVVYAGEAAIERPLDVAGPLRDLDLTRSAS